MTRNGRLQYGVGAHEPIWHRLRTGNAAADEWQRWEQETSPANLDLLQRLGVTRALIACSKGFGLTMEMPLIDRAARFCDQAAQRGIATDIYVQGFPIYYEAFLAEMPEAEQWLARDQFGQYIPWGGQTFRRWIDPTRREFWEHETTILSAILQRFRPAEILMDNTIVLPFYSDSARRSFREYLADRYPDPLREFGIPTFDHVDLPRFDPTYFPRDAYRVVKDPLLQEWARWRSWLIGQFLGEMRAHVHALSPQTRLISPVGRCDGLRYNQLFTDGIDQEDRLAALDGGHMEESGWRPGCIVSGHRMSTVQDERNPDDARNRASAAGDIRVSTDARWWKIAGEYGVSGHGGFWGETDKTSRLIAAVHNMAFARNADDLGTIGPLAAHESMLADFTDLTEWSAGHMDILRGRERRYAPVAVWRSTASLGFVRHRPVWEACAIEQMLFEQHVPFTILLDGGLERFLAGRKLLILPGASCICDRQVELITAFVEQGGTLLLLSDSGTRDQRTRVRRRWAFAHLFGGDLPNLESYGPPHWVPELDLSPMPETLRADVGRGRVAFVKQIVPATPLDLSRDPYMPERQVMTKDIVPPANEGQIMEQLDGLLRDTPRLSGPRWVLAEYWIRGRDLLICLANLHRSERGGPIEIELGGLSPRAVRVHRMFDPAVQSAAPDAGRLRLGPVDRFATVVLEGAL